jgi:hypothetical protein
MKKMRQERIDEYRLLEAQLGRAYIEMSNFAKKNPTEKISILKLQLINRILNAIKELLKEEPSTQYLDILNEEDLLSISDTVLIMGQHISALQQFKKKYI